MDRRVAIKRISLLGLASIIPGEMMAHPLPGKHDSEVCQLAWKNLGKFPLRRYDFRYIDPVKKLPNIFLYGDSISIGYTEYVREALKGKASVFRLHVNGGSSDQFIEKMDTLHDAMFQPDLKKGWDFNWDLIHFNVGLHDLKYLYQGKLNRKQGIQVNTIAEYEENLRRIVRYLKKLHRKSKLVFATTTYIPEGEPGRMHGDELRYNEAARRVMNEFPNVIINDLHKFSIPVSQRYAASEGNVHYLHEGSRELGIEVARLIGRELKIEPNVCPQVEEIRGKFDAYEFANGYRKRKEESD